MFSRSRFGRASRMPVNAPSVPNTPNAGENTGIKTATVGDEVYKNPSASELMTAKQKNNPIIRSMLGSAGAVKPKSSGIVSSSKEALDKMPEQSYVPVIPRNSRASDEDMQSLMKAARPSMGLGAGGPGQDQQIPNMKKGGKVKGYASGGSVRGSGCEQRGTKKWKVY